MTITSSNFTQDKQWFDICELIDILPSMGRCALFNDKQIAIFRVITPSGTEDFYAIDNFCPFSNANTLSRGITGNLDGKTVIASPIYKQHFDLSTGVCLEDESVKVNTYLVRLEGGTIQLAA